MLPHALELLALTRIFEGDLDGAETLLQEAEAIAEATRTEPIGFARFTLAGFRGDEAALAALSEAVEPRATARGDGMTLTFGEHARALAFNGLGRYDAALPTRESASRARRAGRLDVVAARAGRGSRPLRHRSSWRQTRSSASANGRRRPGPNGRSASRRAHAR